MAFYYADVASKTYTLTAIIYLCLHNDECHTVTELTSTTTPLAGRSGLVVNMSDCGVKGPRFESTIQYTIQYYFIEKAVRAQLNKN